MDAVTQANQQAPHGWYPDPQGSGMVRWWDGFNWTQHVQPMPAAVQQQAQPAFVAQPQQFQSQPSSYDVMQAAGAVDDKANASLDFADNPKSLIAIAVAFAYVILAATTGIVLLGIVPAAFAFRAFERGEKLAPLAAIAVGIAFVFALTQF